MSSDPLKIAIVGKAPSFNLAPYDDPSWEIWTLSDLVSAGQAKRCTRHFEIHRLDWFDEDPAKKVYWDWMRSADVPIYLQKPDERIPAGVEYPKQAIVDQFGGYFTNTVSWLIAYAITLKPSHISVYGVDMAQVESDGNAEYERQRPSCEHLLGWAAGAGIETYVPPEADLLKCRQLYGFETDVHGMWAKCRTRRQELQKQINHFQAKAQEFHEKAIHAIGALNNMNWTEQWI